MSFNLVRVCESCWFSQRTEYLFYSFFECFVHLFYFIDFGSELDYFLLSTCSGAVGYLPEKNTQTQVQANKKSILATWQLNCLIGTAMQSFLSQSEHLRTKQHTWLTHFIQQEQLPRSKLQTTKLKINNSIISDFFWTMEFDGLGFCSHFGRQYCQQAGFQDEG